MTFCFNSLNATDDEVTDGMLANHAVGILGQAANRSEPFFIAVGCVGARRCQ
jgi:hypothetical protein